MPRLYDHNKQIILLIGDLMLIILTTYLTVTIRQLEVKNVLDVYTGATAFSVMVYFISFYIFDLYNVNYKFKSTFYLSRFLLAVFTATAVVAIAFYSFPFWKFGRGVFLMNMGLVAVLTYSWRLFFQSVFISSRKPKVIVIVGSGDVGRTIYDLLRDNSEFVVKGFLDDEHDKSKHAASYPILGSTNLLPGMIERREIDAAVIALKDDRDPQLLKTLVRSKRKGIEIYDMPSLYEPLTGKIPIEHLTDHWIAYTPFHGVKRNIYMMKIKKLLDSGLALGGLILAIPIILITVMAIKCNSRGPVLYRQKRVGLGGEVFDLLKFRSMVVDAEANGAVWAQKNDSRMTGVGKIIRKARIDEIPQMWNVLKGDMSFIGPRPERPEFVKTLVKDIPYYFLRHMVKPGITGWAQVNFRYGASRDDALEKLQYDIYYIKNLSIFLDFQILLRTIRVVLLGVGAR